MTNTALDKPDIPDHVPADLVHRFDFKQDDAIRQDAYAVMYAMADKPDIFWSPDLGGYWVVTRADWNDEVFVDHERFSVSTTSIPALVDGPKLMPNNFDPPEHAKYRKPFSRLLSGKALAGVDEETRQLATQLLDEMQAGHCDFVTEYAEKLPIDVFLARMGIDPEMRDTFVPWVNATFRGATMDEVIWGMTEMNEFFVTWLQEQLANPAANTSPMFRELRDARIEGRELTFEELVNMTSMLVFGGLDTITSQVSHLIRFLAENPAHRQFLIDHPDEIPRALEELLRRFGISNIGRIVAKDCDFHGVAMKKGDSILASTPISGLDQRAFHDPLTVDFDRDPSKKGVQHNGFGAGPHLCPGALLARKQLRITIEEVLHRMPNLRVAAGAVIETYPGATLRLMSLPLEWDVS